MSGSKVVKHIQSDAKEISGRHLIALVERLQAKIRLTAFEASQLNIMAHELNLRNNGVAH